MPADPPPFSLHPIHAIVKKLKDQKRKTHTVSGHPLPKPLSSYGTPHTKQKPTYKGPPQSAPADPSKVRIQVSSYKDPQSGQKDKTLAVLKVSKGKMSAEDFAARLADLGLDLAPGHTKVMTGQIAHIAVVSRVGLKRAAHQHPGAFKAKSSVSPQPQKISAGCVVFDSLEDMSQIYVALPSNNFGPWCFSEDTDILTRRGWVAGLDLELTDEVATLVGDEVVYEQPQAINVQDYEGELIHFASRDLDQLVTPDHRMWVCREKREAEERYSFDRFEFIRARNMPLSASFRRHASWNGEERETYTIPAYEYSRRVRGGKELVRAFPDREVPMDAWLAFMGWFLSEGFASTPRSGSYAVITQREGPTADQIRAVLDRLPWRVYEHTSERSMIKFEIRDRQLWAHLHDGKRASEKRIPDYIGELSPRQLRIFLGAYLGGDGGYIEGHPTRWSGPPKKVGRPRVLQEGEISDRTPVFYTASRGMADDLSILILKVGMAPKVRLREHREGDGHFGGPMYVVTANKPHRKLCASSVERVPYKGKVWCPATTSGVIYVRRNGKSSWSGNTLPKGGVDKGESMKQAAVRETFEETGLKVKILPGPHAYVGSGKSAIGPVSHFFLAVKVGGSPAAKGWETEKVRLVTFEEAKKLFGQAHGGKTNKRDPMILDRAKQALKHFD
jgi:ADP-ribose pyrophosphatase YjhB (NUDIX family)